jgi:vacuolar-type H+-ATPase subunit H
VVAVSLESEADELLNQSAKDASQITSAAKRDAQKLITDAARNIVDYRSWLSSAISEAERLHRAQNSSLNAAEQAIQESRQKLRLAFDRLSQLQADINANLDGESKPTGKVFVAGAGKKAAQAAVRKQKAANSKKPASKKKSK